MAACELDPQGGARVLVGRGEGLPFWIDMTTGEASESRADGGGDGAGGALGAVFLRAPAGRGMVAAGTMEGNILLLDPRADCKVF